MAKEKPCCVLCGREAGFLNRAYLPLYNTNQVVCTPCMQDYMEASREERDRLKEKMMNSPHLVERDRIQSLMNWRQEDEQRRQEKQHMVVLDEARRERAALCCGQQMTLQGTTKFSISRNGESTVRELALYECATCGRVKFFKPES